MSESMYYVIFADDDTVRCYTAKELIEFLQAVIIKPADAGDDWAPEQITVTTRLN